MARPVVVLSGRADLDLDNLFDLIAEDSGAQRAKAVLLRIKQTMELVATMPGMGRVRDDLKGDPRTFAVWPWLIVYEARPDGQGIYVWRVIDGRRDVPRHVKRQ